MTRSHYLFRDKLPLKLAPWVYMVLVAVVIPLAFLPEFGCAKKVVPVLSVGSNQWPGYEPMYAAQQLGWLNKHDIKLMEYTSTTEVIDALKFGLLDAAGLTLDEFLTAREAGVDVSIVMVLDASDGADALIAKSNIKQLSDLKGKYIAVESTAVGELLLQAALKKSGLQVSDIHRVYATPSEHVTLFRQGKVDAVVSFNPYLSKLEALGGNRLFDSAMIPETIVDVLVVRDAMVAEQTEHIQALIHHTLKASNYLRFDKNANDVIRLHRLVDKKESQNLLNGIKLSYLDENYNFLVAEPHRLSKTIHDIEQTILTRRKEQGVGSSMRHVPQENSVKTAPLFHPEFIQKEMQIQQGL